jgi:LPS-assembly lipoprotein
MPVMRRRDWLARVAWAPGMVLGVATGLSACGFRLRQPVELPFTRLALKGFKPRAPMADEIRLALPAKVHLTEPAQAEVVLVVVEDAYEKTVAASTAAGQVAEFTLRVRLRFQLERPNGDVLLPETKIELQRDLSYSESAALAKETEENTLVRDMRADIASQLLQILAVRMHKPGA